MPVEDVRRMSSDIDDQNDANEEMDERMTLSLNLKFLVEF